MAERRLFILESYYPRDNRNESWRIINADGLSWREDITQFTFIRPVYCKPAVFDEMTKVQSLLERSGDKW
jgi:hypothetical protein